MTKETTIDINEFLIKKYIESIRPENEALRKQIDYGYSYDGKIVILYEIRPAWDNPNELEHFEFAKIRFYKSRGEWNLYWMRASGKWALYDPFPISTNLDEMIETIKNDKFGCFFG
ncbi:DUF3024 domain-containing protein [Tamlana sp. I1]|uniref:DUF3024 domain-containing protein n=1 Tax=Tamlana sp. I1 TaxID=2762061 RepID=UPI0018905385|nr:DUF3024 domain-containing protein [Tamlana sp. I1]